MDKSKIELFIESASNSNDSRIWLKYLIWIGQECYSNSFRSIAKVMLNSNACAQKIIYVRNNNEKMNGKVNE